MNIEHIVQTTDSIDKTDTIEFDITGVHRYIPNSLRRTILSKIDSLVFKGFPHKDNNINITENSSRFHNEYLKHRIECIPIQISQYINFDSYMNNYDYVLDVENTTTEKIIVTSADLKLHNIKKDDIKRLNYLPNFDGNHIPICYLYPRISQTDPIEKLKLSISLTKGNASKNASWNVVSKCVFFNTEDVDEIEKQASKIQDRSKQIDFRLLEAQRIYVDKSFKMNIVSVGIYTCPVIITLACDVLINTLSAIELEIDTTEYTNKNDLVIPNTNLIYLHTINKTHIIRLENEDYTIGTLIENGLFNQPEVKTVAFLKEHAHDTYSFIKMTLNSDVVDEADEFKRLLKVSIKSIISIYTDIKTKFI